MKAVRSSVKDIEVEIASIRLRGSPQFKYAQDAVTKCGKSDWTVETNDSLLDSLGVMLLVQSPRIPKTRDEREGQLEAIIATYYKAVEAGQCIDQKDFNAKHPDVERGRGSTLQTLKSQV